MEIPGVVAGERKAAAVMRTHPQVLAAGNPGCTLHIQRLLRARGIELRAAHPVEILDASIRGVDLPAREPHDTKLAVAKPSAPAASARR